MGESNFEALLNGQGASVTVDPSGQNSVVKNASLALPVPTEQSMHSKLEQTQDTLAFAREDDLFD